MAVLAFAAPALAGDIGVSFGINTGMLGLKAPAAQLGGTVAIPITVVDARGNGAGWNLRLGGAGAPVVTRVAVRCAAGTTCTLPQASVSLPRTLGAEPTTVLAAAARSGLGAIVVFVTVSGGRGPLAARVTSR